MDLNIDDKEPWTDGAPTVSDAQINPLTIMTSMPPYTPVDENEKNILQIPNIDITQPQSSEAALSMSLYADVSSPNILMSSSNFDEPKISSNVHMDSRSVAAWVESTTTSTVPGLAVLERSPSLPSTLIEPFGMRARRDSNVSTICDHQQSVISDTLTSQELPYSNDIQRSLSVPLIGHNYCNELNLSPHEEEEEEDDDDEVKFFPVPESEESEVDRKTKKLPSVDEDHVFVEGQSPTNRESPKKSPNVSSHTSISFETHSKSIIPPRRRRNTWNISRNKLSFDQNSQPSKTSTQPPSLHAQLLRRKFRTALSVPHGTHFSVGHSTRQSSDHSHRSPSNIPSSSSIISSHQNTSFISDASGQSGIESTNLETSVSDPLRTLSLEDEKPIERKLTLRRQSHCEQDPSHSSETPSTQSLSSSDDAMNNFTTKMKDTSLDQEKRKGPTDKRRDVLKQLMWLLEKKTTIYARYGLGRRSSGSVPKQTHAKSTPNSFVELYSSLRSTNALTRNEPDLQAKILTGFRSNSNEASHSLSSQVSYIEAMNQSFSSVRSTHSDSSATTSLVNTKAPLTATGSLPRKRSIHRRNLNSLAAVTRDRKNSLNKSDQQAILQTTSQELEPKSPLVRNIDNILNEHLIMINNLLTSYAFTANLQYSSQNPSFRDFLYTRLHELSQQNPMYQRCSRVETKAFIDIITNLQMNRAHHYSFLTHSVKDLLITTNDTVRFPYRYSETEDDLIKDGHIASNESSNTSSPSLTRYTSRESKYEANDDDDHRAFNEQPLRFFRTLSRDYIHDCEQTESELTKLFDLADQQDTLYCLKHVESGHTNDMLATFHQRLDALFVWYNLYYELTISVKKLSGLLRCDDCDDWPKLRFRSIATNRERKAKRADENDVDYYSTDDEVDSEEIKTAEESEIENDLYDSGDSDILPKSYWPEEPSDNLPPHEISDQSTENETTSKIKKLTRIDCYRNFVYYMDKRSYQVKYDGLARTLIERVAPVLLKTRLALLQTHDRHKIKLEQVLAGLSSCEFQSSNLKRSESKIQLNNDDIDDKLVDTDNPVNENSTADIDIGELTIEKWLFHALKSSSIIKAICSHKDDILKHNWLELHQQLGLPSLLPLYLFIMSVLLDVMNECLRLYNKPYMNNDTTEIDSLCRQQLVREAKLVLRDALATRLYSVRMMEQFISHRKIIYELMEFDENTVKLYTHYKQFLSTVCINRTCVGHNDKNILLNNETNIDAYYYVDEETSELIKEYYFARDLTVTLGNRTEIRDLCTGFSTLIQRIFAQLKEELNGTTEKYYQVFAIDMNETSTIHNGSYSADATSEFTKSPPFQTSASAPHDLLPCDSKLSNTMASFSDQKKNDIISSTREFRRDFDTIKQRTTRVCHLAKTLIDDFSIAVEFNCSNYNDLWKQLRQYSYTQVKIFLNKNDADDFDNFYVFVPPWLSVDKDQVENLLNIVCTQQTPLDENNKINTNNPPPSYMIFVPKKSLHRHHVQWTGEILFIQLSESTKLALNSTEISPLHLVVNRSEQWQNAVNLFNSHVGLSTIQLIRKLPRDEGIRLTLDQLPEHIEKLSTELTDLVRTLNTIWDQDSTKIYLTEIVKFDERTIESKLVDLVLYVYNSGFDLFRLLYDLIPTISPDNDEIIEKFVRTMNEFFCQWCKCVTKKYKNISVQQARTAKSKVFRPKWISPGMVFLRFFARSTHLQLLSDEDYKKLTEEMPAALNALYGIVKGRSNSISSTLTHSGRLQKHSSTSGHRRQESGGRYNEIIISTLISPPERITRKIKALENDLEKKFRERKLIGKICNPTALTSGITPDPVISLKTRNIDFPWRRGTRIGEGGAGVAFRAINCSNGSLVCMKEIQLSSIASRSLPNAYPAKLRQIAEEIDMIMSINHPNIVRYFGIEKYKRTIYICMEYCLSTVNEFLNDIRLFEKRAHIKRKNSVLWSDSSEQDDDGDNDRNGLTSTIDINENVRGFVRELLHALMTLHENNIVHCDVKGDNIFIANENGKYIVKLGDFNLSHRFELEPPTSDRIDSRSTQKGTIFFKPPEPVYVYKSDIWALGCTIIEMLTGKLPWTNVTCLLDLQIYIQNQLLAKKGPPIPDELKTQKEAYEFIELCLKPDLEERRSARELLNHPYPRVRTGT